MASSDKVESVDVACLGQPFQLGMLYNCHRDHLIQGDCFWDSETLGKATQSSHHKSSGEYKILREYGIKMKGEILEIVDDLLLSFMAGMVPVTGSAKFLHDEMATSKIQRMALFFKCVNQSDQLQVEKLGSFPSSDMVKNSEATHIVTGITFGVSAFFVFDKTSSDVLDAKAALDLKKRMEELVKTIPAMLATNAEKAEMLELNCTLHSDVTWQENPNTWDETVKAYEELTKLAMLVPLKAHLEPLSKYNIGSGGISERLISKKMAIELLGLLEHLQIANFEVTGLLECHRVCSYFEVLQKQLTLFQGLLKEYMTKSVKFLQETLPKVRSGIQKMDEISNFLKLSSTSPFSAAQLSAWIGEKRAEVRHLTGSLQSLQEIELVFATDKLDEVTHNDAYDNVLCLSISLVDQDSFLTAMSNHLLSKEVSSCEQETPWYKDMKEMKHLWDMIRHFKEFAKANRDNKRLKSIVSISSEEGKHCVKIDCYEYGLPKAFVPPGPPSKLEVANITNTSVELRWAEPTIGATYVENYCVSYHPSESLSDELHKLHTQDASTGLKIGNLQPATCYEFKVRAVCTAGCSQESDITSIKTVAQLKKFDRSEISSAKAKHSVYLKKPNALKVTCHTVTLGWSKPEGAKEDVNEYSVEYCLLSNSAKAWERFEDILNGTVKKVTITGLCMNSAYIFRVLAVFPSKQCVASDVSDKLSTKSYFLKKPCISHITECGVNLNWTKPEESDIQQYSVLCQSCSDPAKAWHLVGDTIAGHKDQIAISALSPAAKYNFKIIAQCEDGTKVESQVSKCETKGLVVLKRAQCISAQEHTITLRWMKPIAEEATRIQKCYIAYQSCSASNEEWKRQPMVPANSSITIAELKAYTSYKFKIIAQLNSGREVESPQSDFITTKPPSKLAKPAICSVTERSVLLSCSKPEGVHVEYYSVHYRTQGYFGRWSGWNKCTKVQVTEEAFRVEGLCSGTVYSFKVLAFYEGGKVIESDISDRCDVKRTLALHVPMITDVTDQSVSLQWSKPVGAGGNEYQVKRYTVRYCPHNNPGKRWTSLNIDKSFLMATVYNLSHDTEYVFDVSATMVSGGTVSSEPSGVIMTKPLCCPGLPKTSTDSITDDSIHIFWAKPSSCIQTVSSYTILYWKADENLRNRMILDCNSIEDEKVLDHLEPQTKYTFKIRANRKHSKSFESEEATYQTQPLCGVCDLNVVCCTDHTAMISWSKVDTTARIKCFEVSYKAVALHPQKEMEWSRKRTESAEEMSMKFKNLTPATGYECMVHALLNTDKKASLFSQGKFTMDHPCRPGKPELASKSNNSVTIQWGKTAYHYERVRGYTVIYQSIDDTTKWNSVKLSLVTENTIVNNLRSSTFYYFVVKPMTDDPDLGVFSERSEPIRTKDECKPGKPEILTVRDTSVQLKWAAPEYDASEVEQYEILYLCTTDPDQKWESFKQLVYAQRERMITVSGLQPKTEYEFKVRVASKGNLVCVDSYCSNPTSTKAEPPAKQLLPKCTQVRKEAPAIYQLPINIVPLDGDKMLRKCEIGMVDQANPGEDKVLMLVGATGAGKTTLVNGITNYILGVSWEDNFRFQLIGDEGGESQASSQTREVTAYTFHKMEGSFLDYTLTIVDTPGFGDTSGLEQDKEIMKRIEQFFSKSDGITFLNGIGFVAQASLPRLTPTQKYIFNTVLGIFGKDVAQSISIMATFADGKKPPLYAAIDKADIPIQGKYTFNNSALYEDQDSQFASLFFEMGAESFRSFFQQFEKAQCISLLLTKEVLAERRKLEATVQSLHKQVHQVLCKMDQLRQLEQVLEGHKTQIDQNKNFIVTVTQPKLTKVDLPTGVHTTNCLQCNFTCHENCVFANHDDKYNCCAMGCDGMCRNCPKHCHWKQHVNNPYKFIVKEVRVSVSSEEIEARYYSAKSKESKSKDMIKNVKSEYYICAKQAQDLVKQVKECLECLAEIALRPNPLTEEEYIDLLIDSEKREKKPRWKERIQSYEDLKQQGQLLQRISRGEAIVETEDKK